MTAESAIDERSLRAHLREKRGKSASLALAIFAVDLLLYAACLYGALRFADTWRGWCFGLAQGACIAMLFVVGHDACHGSFTAGRTLNLWIGRVAFLPSLTPFRTWELGHNQTHHVYTNLKPLDYVWVPFSKTEFDHLPRWRQWLERVYRTAPGVGVYYALEIWWRRLFFPRGSRYWRDCWLCAAYGAALSVCAITFGWRAWLTAVVWPFVCWNWLMGWAIFEHHTHPDVPWFDDEAAWRAAGAQVACTVHVILPTPFDALLHFIMQHTAHHLDVTIPLYRLRDAQRMVEDSGTRLVVYHWTPATFFRHLKICKLYDFERRCWVGFDGLPLTSSAPAPPAPSRAPSVPERDTECRP